MTPITIPATPENIEHVVGELASRISPETIQAIARDMERLLREKLMEAAGWPMGGATTPAGTGPQICSHCGQRIAPPHNSMPTAQEEPTS